MALTSPEHFSFFGLFSFRFFFSESIVAGSFPVRSFRCPPRGKPPGENLEAFVLGAPEHSPQDCCLESSGNGSTEACKPRCSSRSGSAQDLLRSKPPHESGLSVQTVSSFFFFSISSAGGWRMCSCSAAPCCAAGVESAYSSYSLRLPTEDSLFNGKLPSWLLSSVAVLV